MLKINSVKAIYDYDRPYQSFKEEDVSGSGFIISEKGLLATNSNLVLDAINIIARSEKTGKRDFDVEIVGICREKELALCKILDFPKNEIFKFGDSMKLKSGDKVFSLNPSNTGIISSFNSEYTNQEDSLLRSPCYIKTNFTGSLGSPVFNYNNEVIGIFSKENNLFPKDGLSQFL